MSTRGAIGIRINGVDKVMYNHCDSYPEGLGKDFVAQVRRLVKRKNLKELAANWRAVKDGDKPTPEDVKKCAPVSDFSVSRGSPEDWYCLLRNAQGNLPALLKCGIFIDGAAFLKDSLFCEYAYILNLDTEEVEFYRGFNQNPNACGRYARLCVDDRKRYYGVAFVAAFPMRRIPRIWKQAFEAYDKAQEEKEAAATPAAAN